MSEHAFSDVATSVDSTARSRFVTLAGRDAPTVSFDPNETTTDGGC
ncbi:hypothetical protein [Haloarchaeobius sp. DT45]